MMLCHGKLRHTHKSKATRFKAKKDCTENIDAIPFMENLRSEVETKFLNRNLIPKFFIGAVSLLKGE